MDDDSLPPGVTRGPYKGQRQPRATPLMFVGPLFGVFVCARLAVDRWNQFRDGWTVLYLGGVVLGIVVVLLAIVEFRRLRSAGR